MRLLYFLLALAIIIAITTSVLSAQTVNTGPYRNDSSAYVSDYGAQFINDTTGAYSGNGGTFDHAGDFINNGSYNATSGTDNFIGPYGLPGTQTISGITQPAFYDLNLNNGSAALLAITNTHGIKVADTLGFNNGLITTTRAYTSNGALEFGPSAGYTSGPITSAHHVNGYVTKTNMNGFTFPTGNGAIACPITVNSGASPTDKISIAYIGADPTGNDPTSSNAQPRSSMGSGLVSVSPIGFWDIINISGTPTLDITVKIPGIAYITAADMRLVGWNFSTSKWEILSSNPPTGNTAGNTISMTLPASPGTYSAFALGSISENPVALAVSFTEFAAAAKGDCGVEVSWTAVEDERNDFYLVQRAHSGYDWSDIRKVMANGKSTAPMHYSVYDGTAPEGKSQYRVAGVDVSGRRQYTSVAVVSVHCSGLGHGGEIVVHPTLTNGLVYVELPAGYEGASVRLLNMLGQKLSVRGIDGTQPLHRSVDLGDLPAAFYMLQVINEGEITSFKINYQP